MDEAKRRGLLRLSISAILNGPFGIYGLGVFIPGATDAIVEYVMRMWELEEQEL